MTCFICLWRVSSIDLLGCGKEMVGLQERLNFIALPTSKFGSFCFATEQSFFLSSMVSQSHLFP